MPRIWLCWSHQEPICLSSSRDLTTSISYVVAAFIRLIQLIVSLSDLNLLHHLQLGLEGFSRRSCVSGVGKTIQFSSKPFRFLGRELLSLFQTETKAKQHILKERRANTISSYSNAKGMAIRFHHYENWATSPFSKGAASSKIRR